MISNEDNLPKSPSASLLPNTSPRSYTATLLPVSQSGVNSRLFSKCLNRFSICAVVTGAVCSAGALAIFTAIAALDEDGRDKSDLCIVGGALVLGSAISCGVANYLNSFVLSMEPRAPIDLTYNNV